MAFLLVYFLQTFHHHFLTYDFKMNVASNWELDLRYTVWGNHRNSLIQHGERSILSAQKFIKNAKNGLIWGFWENLELTVKQCYQTGLFHLSNFPTMCLYYVLLFWSFRRLESSVIFQRKNLAKGISDPMIIFITFSTSPHRSVIDILHQWNLHLVFGFISSLAISILNDDTVLENHWKKSPSTIRLTWIFASKIKLSFDLIWRQNTIDETIFDDFPSVWMSQSQIIIVFMHFGNLQ